MACIPTRDSAGSLAGAASFPTAAVAADGVNPAAVIRHLSLAVPYCVEKSDGAVLTGADPIFTIAGGPIRCTIYGIVTTIIGGAATCKLTITTTSPAANVAREPLEPLVVEVSR